MDKIVDKIVALGVPGLVLLIAISGTGLAGGAALTTALAALGPFGMIGGIALLGIIGLISKGISDYGFEKIYYAVMKELQKKGESKETIMKKIKNYPISKTLKLKLKAKLEEL